MRHALPWLPLVVVCAIPAAHAQNTLPAAACKVATDAAYGYSVDKPIQVGGSPMYGAARQRRYLGLLTGPQGQAVTFERGGSVMGPDKDTMLDRYVVRYDGLAQPLTLYLDWYHYTETIVPKGLGCTGPVTLGTPPPDPFQLEEQYDALAAAAVRASIGPLAPVPLGDDTTAGFVLDRFRILARPAPPGATVPKPHRTIVVVNPMQCDGQRVVPSAITLASPRGESVEPVETFSAASRFAALATGLEVPAGSLGAVFAVDGVMNGVEVRATFESGCTGPLARSWRMRVRSAELVAAPRPARPESDTSGAPFVAVQAIVDHAGVFRETRPLGGEERLTRAAVEALNAWTMRPATANGVPLTMGVVTVVYFADVPPKP